MPRSGRSSPGGFAASATATLSPELTGSHETLITPEIQGLLDAALTGMKDGSVVTCPETCGTATQP